METVTCKTCGDESRYCSVTDPLVLSVTCFDCWIRQRNKGLDELAVTELLPVEAFKDVPAILTQLEELVDRRPRLGNFSPSVGVNAARHRSQAMELIDTAAGLPHSPKRLREAFKAYNSRLTWDGHRLRYIAGQLWEIEYRQAVLAVVKAYIGT